MLIAKKLPIAAAVMTVVSVTVASAVGIYLGSKSLTDAAYSRLEAISDGRRNQIETYLINIEKDLEAVSQRKDILSALVAITKAYDRLALTVDPTEELQRRYIFENPNPLGEKHLLETADIDSYDQLHGRYHQRFVSIMEAQGYYDVFLVDPKGNIVYSVFKELDFATNLNDGQWAKTDIATVFKDAMADEEDRIKFSDYSPYEPSAGAPASFIGKKVMNGQKVVGALIFQMPSDAIQTIMNNRTGLGETGETLIVNKAGYLITESSFTDQPDVLSTQIKSDLLRSVAVDNLPSGEITGYRNDQFLAAATMVDFENAGWVVLALNAKSEALAGVTEMRNGILIAAAILFASMVIISIRLSAGITRPITDVVEKMKILATGDTNIELDQRERKDEIGNMIKAVSTFRDAAIDKFQLEERSEEERSAAEQERILREQEKAKSDAELQLAVDSIAEGLSQLSAGDLTVKINQPFTGDLDTLRQNFNESVSILRETLSSISQASREIDEGADHMRATSDQVSQSTETQAASLEETSAALEEITGTVNETSSQATEAAEMAKHAAHDTEQSAKIVDDAVSAMGGIEQASSEISNIVNVIDEIAFQTNLLALNAGVEAARAGEAGKGFAVVAQEVRELAQRSASAAKEIQSLIERSTNEISNGVQLVKKTGEALSTISGHVNSINTRIGTIAEAANEQLSGIQSVNQTVGQMDAMTQQNASRVQQSNDAVKLIADKSLSLVQRIGKFKLDRTHAPMGSHSAKNGGEAA